MSASKVLQLDIDLTDAFETPLEAVNGLLRKVCGISLAVMC